MGEEKMLRFIDDRLVTGSVDFFTPIKKTKLKTGLEKVKRTPAAITVVKEDRQAFGLLVSKPGNLQEAFTHPITSVPLSIATADSTLRQSDKATLQRFLLEESQCIKDKPSKSAVWIVDGMAAVRSLKPKTTYRAWMNSLIKFVTPKAEMNASEVHIVNDTYLDKSVKNDTRKKRGEPGPRVHLEGYDQNMLQGSKWHEFLYRNENKTVCNGRVQELEECNHEEADTRLILHAVESKQDVVIVAKDTDVLVLMVWAFAFLDVQRKWFFRKDDGQFADVGEICSHFGKDICIHLPALHALSGCDATSYFYNVGKVKLLKTVVKIPRYLALLDSLGKEKVASDSDIEDVQKFVQMAMYSGKEKESYVETRVRLYHKMKVKSSLSLPPDPHSLKQAILRAHWQTYYWLRCTEALVENLSSEGCGWKWSPEESCLKPVWFTCPQLPPSLRSRRKNKCQRSESDGADVESDSNNHRAPKKRKRCTKLSEQTRRDNEDSARTEDKDTTNQSDSDLNSTGFSDEQESEWEVADLSSSEDSGDEWIP
ncbi:Uncharacterised protein r2_g2746 [Pycnogonum litorale]